MLCSPLFSLSQNRVSIRNFEDTQFTLSPLGYLAPLTLYYQTFQFFKSFGKQSPNTSIYIYHAFQTPIFTNNHCKSLEMKSRTCLLHKILTKIINENLPKLSFNPPYNTSSKDEVKKSNEILPYTLGHA